MNKFKYFDKILKIAKKERIKRLEIEDENKVMRRQIEGYKNWEGLKRAAAELNAYYLREMEK